VLPGVAIPAACSAPAGYEPAYEPATMPGLTLAGMLAVNRQTQRRPKVGMSEPKQGGAPAGLFLVERRLPKAGEQELAVAQAALSSAAARFAARGDGVRYLQSIFLARQGRLLSLFTAGSLDEVRAVNEAALIPFTSIEAAIELPGAGQR
jgi:hypothetical protein